MGTEVLSPGLKRGRGVTLTTHRHLGRAMAQAVSRRPLTAEALVRGWSIHVGFVVDKVALGQFFLRVLRFALPLSFHRCSPYPYHLGDEQYVR
jgi:hypothetical protein